MKRVKYNPNTRMKKASGFVSDFATDNSFTMPAFVKLSHEECFSLYKTSEWLNAVVTRVVNDCVKVPPRVRLREDGKELTEKHKREIKEINDFLRRPNPNKESFAQIRWKFILDKLLQGRGAMEKVKSTKGKIKELYSLTTNGLHIRQDENGNLRKRKTYRLKPRDNSALKGSNRNKTRFFNLDECIHSVFRPSADTSYGIKPIDVLCSAISSDILRTDYNGRFFLNNGEASGILSVEGMGKTDFRKFREYWKTAYKGTRNAHKLAVVNTKINYARMSVSNRDMEFTEFGKELRNKIMAVFQMQPFIMGVVDGTTGKLNSSQQVTTYKDGAIKPILVQEAYLYTEEIIRDGFGYDEYEIVFDSIDLLDAKEQADVDTTNLENMTTTINEVRKARGQRPVPWGDTPVSIKPGGAQIDPDTGRLIPPNAQADANNNNSNNNSNNNNPKPPKKTVQTELETVDDPIATTKAKNLYNDFKLYLLKGTKLQQLQIELELILSDEKNKDKNIKFVDACKKLLEKEEYKSDAEKKIDKLITIMNKVTR